MPELLIKKAIGLDSKILSEMSKTTFYQTYVAIHPENTGLLKAYTEEHFSEAKVLEQLQSPEVSFYLAQLGAEVVGYMKTVQGEAPAQVKSLPSLALEKLYVRLEHQGKSVGQRMFDFLRPVAQGLGYESIWLSVYENNQGALEFYRKNGFAVVGETDFVYFWNGSEYRDRDKLMVHKFSL